jgi:Do/DeqQ family serine protease
MLAPYPQCSDFFSGDSTNMSINEYQDSTPPRRGGGRTWAGGATAAAAALLLTGSIIGWTASSAVGPTASAASAPTATAALPATGASYAGVVDQVTPAVVTIRMERRVRNVSQDVPDELRDFFGDQFGFGRRGRQQPERREGGLGSGVVVRPDGYILTNNHVVDHADQLRVELSDGRSFKAKVVGTDAATDLAVVKIEGTKLPTLPLGDSDAVRVGDVVLAVGNPLGVGQTVTMGIVSAKGRATEGGNNSYEDFIQTDAPINQGNSGGPLVNTRGELVGINSQILSPSGGNIGIGFAIPANMAKNVMTQLIDHGQVHRGMIGVTIQPVTSDIASSLGLSQASGALVNSVQPGSPADKAGIRRGDVITSVNGAAVKDSNGLRNNVAQMAPGSTAKMTIVRDGKEKTVDVTLAERQATGSAGEEGSAGSGGSGTFGMGVEPLTRDRAQELGIPTTSGVLVSEVQPGGRAADAGLRAGDVISEVDRKPVNSPDALRAALKDGTKPALLLVHRGGATVYLTIDRQ